ncbi:uncharacterized protein LOC133786089 [Humulus lupulus]|uniref:uncharacterized protein LOC133786089 n=1 Tax=Humulus lupulus TaxID=3486 RepID=UPI002B412A4E|nr:uncharacterized protein LOC133786089 [Humulus lupulus]
MTQRLRDCSNILSWNIRGMNKREKQYAILSLLKMNKVGIGALLENKMKKDKVDDMMAKLAGGRTISAAAILDSNAWLAHTQLASLKSIGSNFTWSNKQNGGDRVYSKIDHVFINEDWIDALPNTIAEFQWDVHSNHCYCLIKTLKHGNLGINPFQFFNLWIVHRGFKEVVIDSWNKPMAVRGLLGVTKKLLRLKHILKAFNREEIGDVEQGYHQAKCDYQLALTRAQASPTDNAAQEAEKIVAVRYQYHSARYISFLIQRSKVTWLQRGDDNNAYFHVCIKKRREENRIVSFLNEQGVIIDDYNKVVHHFLDHFRGYMGSTSSTNSTFNSQCIELGPCLDIEMQLSLIREFRKSDVKKALFSIPGTKSPGPDGYGYEFYKAMWQNIGDDISEAILEFFHSGKIPAELNETVLALVPKTDKPSRAVDYRPIAFIHWVMVCLHGTSYVLMMNGRLQGGFQGVKGLRQGDPISPLLSIGLKANLSKSQVFFGGVSAAVKVQLLQILQLEEGTFPLKYLGIPMRPTKWKVADCGEILKKIKLRLHTWASRHLSYAGRTQLITSVLLGLRNYWMNIFLLPQSTVKEVDKLCLWFLWGNNGTRSNCHLTFWSTVCLPKFFGGLGFGEGAKWNKAMLAKYVWAISHQQETLWVKWINTIYLNGQCFWQYQLKADSSWYWRKICHIREIFTQKEIDEAGSQGRFKIGGASNPRLDWMQLAFKIQWLDPMD